MDFNRFDFTGRLGADPKLEYTAGGVAKCYFSIAVNNYKNEAEWFGITCWRKTAEVCSQYLKKGSAVRVSGSISTYKKDGDSRRSYQFTANEVQFLGGGGQGNTPPPQQDNYNDATPDEDIPF